MRAKMNIQKTLHVSLLAGFVALASGVGTRLFDPRESQTGHPDPGTLSEIFARTSEETAPSVVQVAIFQERRGLRAPLGQGSGVVYSEDGLIITNNHVVRDADYVQVAFSDGREVEAEIMGTDPETDLAVLRVDAQNLRPAVLRTEAPPVGEWVLAMGNPFGIGHTVTAGIISGRGRNNLGIATFEDFLQTDAAINPGNSGGPLIDLQGRVVGINTAVAPATMGGGGLGFAIPSTMVEEIAERLLAGGGKVRRGWLGVYMGELTDLGVERTGYKGPGRVIVNNVVENSPAARAGLVRGDLILSVQAKSVRAKRVRTSRELLDAIAEIDPGTKVDLEVWRSGRTLTVPVTLTAR